MACPLEQILVDEALDELPVLLFQGCSETTPEILQVDAGIGPEAQHEGLESQLGPAELLTALHGSLADPNALFP